ncbi:hypothetical protein PVAP13_4KG181233 [Panicum virgatum]|uniref:Uncharacterized protein n=1 Tax=Panicum virgatum TaxID=38727 RepID=A0A8T0TMZ5_PANVG|nr:hypothetical protein PVAP13_4KG181233 [Panicum virgatum]
MGNAFSSGAALALCAAFTALELVNLLVPQQGAGTTAAAEAPAIRGAVRTFLPLAAAGGFFTSVALVYRHLHHAGARDLHPVCVGWLARVPFVRRAGSSWRWRGSRRGTRARSGCAPCAARCRHGDLLSGHLAHNRRAHPRRWRGWRWRRRRKRTDRGARGAPRQDGHRSGGWTRLPHGHGPLRRLLISSLKNRCWLPTVKVHRGDALTLPDLITFP